MSRSPRYDRERIKMRLSLEVRQEMAAVCKRTATPMAGLVSQIIYWAYRSPGADAILDYWRLHYARMRSPNSCVMATELTYRIVEVPVEAARVLKAVSVLHGIPASRLIEGVWTTFLAHHYYLEPQEDLWEQLS